jgi:anti-sigma factor ChrR (cupin superfamily)
MSTAQVSWSRIDTLPLVELYPGVRKRAVHEDDGGFRILVVEIDAGKRFLELDVHEPGPEEVYVLSGTFNDGVRDYPAGTFIHNPKGSSHIPQSASGCTLLVIFPRG